MQWEKMIKIGIKIQISGWQVVHHHQLVFILTYPLATWTASPSPSLSHGFCCFCCRDETPLLQRFCNTTQYLH